MFRMRRSGMLLGVAAFVAAVAVVFVTQEPAQSRAKPAQPVFAKKGFPPQPIPSGTASGLSSVRIIEDAKWRGVVNAGAGAIEDKAWKDAIFALQSVLDLDKDSFVQVTDKDAGGATLQRWTSVKFRANSLIGSMPDEGLAQYELAHGAAARTKLEEAKKKGDQGLLAEVAQRFCHTKAGIEANEIQATLYLARGQVFTAALRFDTLLQMNPKRTNLSDVTLFKAALAFSRAGDKKNQDDAWDRLYKNIKTAGYLEVGKEKIPIAKLEAALKDSTELPIVNVHDWVSWRGNVRNTAQAGGSPPLLDTKLWSRPLYRDKLDGLPDEDNDGAAEARLHTAIKQATDANHAVLPGSFPIASQGIMVYRSPRDIRAVALKTIKIRDEESGIESEFKAGQLLWKTIPMNRSTAMLLEKAATRAKIEQWLNNMEKVQGFTSFLFDNSLIGTLVTDHRHVYAINDMGVPAHPNSFTQWQFQPQFNGMNMGELKPLVIQNELHAYDLVTGKLKWDLNHDDKEFKDSHFLSLPIAVGGKLYMLNEKLNIVGVGNPAFGGGIINPVGGDAELRLICIDPNKLVDFNQTKKPLVLEPQVLGTVTDYSRMVQDFGRRVNAVQLAYDEGVLVCPTNAGEVFGIDVTTRSLVWSYPYRENPNLKVELPPEQNQPQPPRQGPITQIYQKWKSSPPAIQDGKVVFTAPDADSVHCINLRDGKPVWRKGKAAGDLYMAGVYGGRVLIVGDKEIRALDLKTGAPAWTCKTGDLPSGQGVASKGIYYLPLKKGEILAVKIDNGDIKAHNRANAGIAPGNLVFYDNMVLSQTPTEVAAYPQLSARLESVSIESKNNPDNLDKMTEYGDLLLKDGQVPLAVNTLHKVYEKKPANPLSKRVNARLFEGLTDLMQMDYKQAGKEYVATYKDLCTVPDDNIEEQSRKSKFYRLVGKGLQEEGKLVEAFQMYKDFGALTIHRDGGGVPSLEDPSQKIPVNVWLRGRISGMLSKATPEERAPLEAAIAKEWDKVAAKKDIDEFRSFVGMFDVPVPVGREARVQLAETIMEHNERGAFLEAEMYLHQVNGSEFRADPKTGGRVLAALAMLEEKKGNNDSLRLAAAYYRELGRDFAKTPVRGTKTGSDLLNELATDKRFLQFLEEGANPFGPVKLAARPVDAGVFKIGQPGFAMLPLGDNTPFTRQNRLVFDLNDPNNPGQPRLRLLDTATNEDRWSLSLGNVPMNVPIYGRLYQSDFVNNAYYPDARFRFYHVKGHLIVCQVGIMIYCVDGDTGKKLWEFQSVEPVAPNIYLAQLRGKEQTGVGDGTPDLLYMHNQTQQQFPTQLGRIGTAQASYVAVIGQKGLTVREPLRGAVMWKRDDVTAHSHVFGDEQYLFLAEANDKGRFITGRTFRANDGELLKVPDFIAVYEARLHTNGRQILAADQGQAQLTVRLYDILAGKDVWSAKFPAGSTILRTEDRNIAGVIDPNGLLTVLDAETGKVLVETNLVQGPITAADIKSLSEPILLQDTERFYVALNQPIDGNKVQNGRLLNNFTSGVRCLPVNGWFVGVQRNGPKKGEFWRSFERVQNQMIVLDHFDQSPIALFTAQYREILNNGGNRAVSVTLSLHRPSGKMIYEHTTNTINGAAPLYAVLQLDLKARTINLIGNSFPSIQHYVDDGKGPPALPGGGAMLNPGFGQPGFLGGGFPPAGVGQPAFGGGFQPGGVLPGFNAPNVRIIDVQDIQVLPEPVLPEIRRR